ncbi:hypothetical protein CAPTEDRAFT_225114 [Capitella teleta]|uniref:GAR domain-containing protein n=1 Tax=Capitella teleta TaxID=283909 RepID=R7TA06_CAPTE|nr:hypothetical protein CAPTEDRAFT_225114 [Capitella teleta]|eukprot:ELT90302.1 hypothetical protein CAPTEDRAFT_225114 [Capitella teleta]
MNSDSDDESCDNGEESEEDYAYSDSPSYDSPPYPALSAVEDEQSTAYAVDPDLLACHLPSIHISSPPPNRQNKLDEALLSSGRVSDALESLLEWLGKAESYLSEDQPISGDLDTVNILIEQHKAFQQELESRQGMVQLMRSSTADATVAAQLDQMGDVWERVNQLSDVRETRLQESLKLAEEFNDVVQVIRDWLPQAESELKFRALPEDEEAIIQLIDSHEKFQESLRSQQPNIEKIRFMAEEILQSCHPNAVRFVKYYLTITQTRWEQALNRSNQRSVRLQEAMRSIRGNAALVEELLAWLTEAQALLNAKEKDPIPEDLTVVEALVREHLEFHDDLSNKNKDVERLTKLVTAGNKKHLHSSQYKLNEIEAPSPRVTTLQNKWRNVWRVSVDRKKKLQDSMDHLLELESFKNFDFDLWRQRYISWIRAKKFRITDFFRRQDKDNDGAVTRKEFVEGMLVSKFPSNRTELNAVFDIFDRKGCGLLDYQEFVEALRPERQRTPRVRTGKKPITDTELITDEIEHQISHCQCRSQFKASKVGEGKYKFGDRGKLCLVRFLNSTVMVRVGGGWTTLAEFLEGNDPCRSKGRTNTELRESFILPEGAAQTRTNFAAKRRSSTPNSALNAKLSGSASSLNSMGRTSNGVFPAKHGSMARSWANLSSSGRTPSLNDRRHGPSRSPMMSPSPMAQSTPRRGTIHTPTPTSARSRPSSAKKESNGRTTPSSTGTRTPNSLRSRSPASVARSNAKSPTPRKASQIPRQNMRF